jgi:uncharacterized protein
MEAPMRKVIVSFGLLAGSLLLIVQSPSIRVRAQEKTTAPRPKTQTPSLSSTQSTGKVDSAKEASIRQLMELTGTRSLGNQMMQAGMEQFRTSVTESQPDNPRAKQFIDAFVANFQKHFNPDALTEKIIPIYDKYLTEEDVDGLLQYYRSPLGQRMLKALPEIARESQQAGYSLGQKAAQETLEDLKRDYPDFVSGKEDDRHPAANPKDE